MNFRAYDLANFFEEMITDYDHKKPPYFKQYPELYPNDKEIFESLKVYLIYS